MEIVNKKKPSCRFDEIEKGQCFVENITSNVNAIYMRMEALNKAYTYAAVDLTTGQLYAFNPDAIVTPIEARVEIE